MQQRQPWLLRPGRRCDGVSRDLSGRHVFHGRRQRVHALPDRHGVGCGIGFVQPLSRGDVRAGRFADVPPRDRRLRGAGWRIDGVSDDVRGRHVFHGIGLRQRQRRMLRPRRRHDSLPQDVSRRHLLRRGSQRMHVVCARLGGGIGRVFLQPLSVGDLRTRWIGLVPDAHGRLRRARRGDDRVSDGVRAGHLRRGRVVPE